MSHRAKNYKVWTWFHEDKKTPAYVGWGEAHLVDPALRIFRHASDYDSELTEWLRGFTHEPPRKNVTPSVKMTKREARAVAEAIRERLRAKGINLLCAKPRDRLGGGGPRKILAPDLTVYGSVRQAAASEGVSPSSITRRCSTEGNGWDYLS
jgi:hypothetical protein